MIPSVGRIVHYTLAAEQADQVNKRRLDASTSQIASTNTGAVAHSGNSATAGQVFPFLITRVWADPDQVTETTAVNGQVFLDGNDSLWVSSAVQGDEPGQWFEPPRVTAPEPDVQASTDAEPYPVAADDPVPVEPPAWSEPADAPLPAEPAGEASPDPAPAEPDTVTATPTDESAPTV